MHWEKEIRIRITLRRIVGTILAASTVANLIIVGAVYGADSAPPASTRTSVPATSLSTSTSSAPAVTAVETSASALTDTPGVPPTDMFTPTQTSTDVPVSILCIKKFYWSTYYVQPGDRLSVLAFDTGSSVRELMAANCLSNDRIYAGQRLYVPRLPIIDWPTFTATVTSTQTSTATETATYTATVIDTATMTNTATASHTPTATATATQTPTTPHGICDQAQLIADVNEPPGTVMLPSTTFTKTWRLMNIGVCTWTTSYAIVYRDGQQFGAPDAISLPYNVAPGQTVDITVKMTAPAVAGSYIGYWMIRNANGAFFGLGPQADQPWLVQIDVIDRSPADAPTVFEDPRARPACNGRSEIYFSVRPVDSDNILSVVVFYRDGKTSFSEALMTPDGPTYYGTGVSITEPLDYFFKAVDGLGNVKDSETYQISIYCPTTPTATGTVTLTLGHAMPEK